MWRHSDVAIAYNQGFSVYKVRPFSWLVVVSKKTKSETWAKKLKIKDWLINQYYKSYMAYTGIENNSNNLLISYIS